MKKSSDTHRNVLSLVSNNFREVNGHGGGWERVEGMEVRVKYRQVPGVRGSRGSRSAFRSEVTVVHVKTSSTFEFIE